MQTKDIFISYKAEEFDKAQWVKTTLESNGISCWMAPECIPGGTSYASEIPKAIRACKVFVLILSSKAQQSAWIPRELDQAINANKTIMPFMIEDCTLTDDFTFYLSNVQRFTAYENETAAIEKLIREIQVKLNVVPKVSDSNKTPAPQTTPSKPKEGNNTVKPAPKKKRNTLGWAILILSLGFIVYYGFIWEEGITADIFVTLLWYTTPFARYAAGFSDFRYPLIIYTILTVITAVIILFVAIATAEGRFRFKKTFIIVSLSYVMWYICYFLCYLIIRIPFWYPVTAFIASALSGALVGFIIFIIAACWLDSLEKKISPKK